MNTSNRFVYRYDIVVAQNPDDLIALVNQKIALPSPDTSVTWRWQPIGPPTHVFDGVDHIWSQTMGLVSYG